VFIAAMLKRKVLRRKFLNMSKYLYKKLSGDIYCPFVHEGVLHSYSTQTLEATVKVLGNINKNSTGIIITFLHPLPNDVYCLVKI
jgi:hypothetical protein